VQSGSANTGSLATEDRNDYRQREVGGPLTILLSLLVLGSAALNIRAEYRVHRRQVYLFKPLTTVLILLIAARAIGPTSPLYKCLIIAGLGCSLAGDVFLMLPADRFVASLVSFLAAHLCYIAAFSLDTSPCAAMWSLAPFLVYVIIMSGILLPHLGKMRVPILVYELVIVAMAWRALGRWAATGEVGPLLAFIGALLFVISDSALAINRFVGKYRGAQALILSTYFCAQWLIALSV